jgi:hypothetical protein
MLVCSLYRDFYVYMQKSVRERDRASDRKAERAPSVPLSLLSCLALLAVPFPYAFWPSMFALSLHCYLIPSSMLLSGGKLVFCSLFASPVLVRVGGAPVGGGHQPANRQAPDPWQLRAGYQEQSLASSPSSQGSSNTITYDLLTQFLQHAGDSSSSASSAAAIRGQYSAEAVGAADRTGKIRPSGATNKRYVGLSPAQIEEKRMKAIENTRKYKAKQIEISIRRQEGHPDPFVQETHRKDLEKLASGRYNGLDPDTRKLDKVAYDKEYSRRERIWKHLKPTGKVSREKFDQSKTDQLEEIFAQHKLDEKQRKEREREMLDLNRMPKRSRWEYKLLENERKWLMKRPELQHVPDKERLSVQDLSHLLENVLAGAGTSSRGGE